MQTTITLNALYGIAIQKVFFRIIDKQQSNFIPCITRWAIGKSLKLYAVKHSTQPDLFGLNLNNSMFTKNMQAALPQN